MVEPALTAVETVAAGAQESAMIGACQLRDDRAGCGMRIAFRGSDRVQPSPESLGIPSRASSPSPGGQKNGVRGVQAGPARLVRPQATPRPRSRLCDRRIYLELEVRRMACRRCGKVKQERLDFLADNPFYTKRFAFYVGRRCRASPIRDVAKELRLDWHTVKALEQQYMREQLRRAGTPGPRATLRGPASCSTSSMSCAIWATPSIRSARASTRVCPGASAASSRGRSTPCWPIARI